MTVTQIKTRQQDGSREIAGMINPCGPFGDEPVKWQAFVVKATGGIQELYTPSGSAYKTRRGAINAIHRAKAKQFPRLIHNPNCETVGVITRQKMRDGGYQYEAWGVGGESKDGYKWSGGGLPDKRKYLDSFNTYAAALWIVAYEWKNRCPAEMQAA
ncbi:MAG: hypothetical protein ACR2PR_11200 [Pseudohongiellaceae bacterium]